MSTWNHKLEVWNIIDLDDYVLNHLKLSMLDACIAMYMDIDTWGELLRKLSVKVSLFHIVYFSNCEIRIPLNETMRGLKTCFSGDLNVWFSILGFGGRKKNIDGAVNAGLVGLQFKSADMLRQDLSLLGVDVATGKQNYE